MKNILEVILITYNRKQYLKGTLEAMFNDESPIKRLNLDFTILDNDSTDGTDKLCKEYASKYQNIKYFKHKKNIGGNANIARAFEIAQKEYVWIIADDDFYDWSAWQEIENVIKTKEYDAILTLKKSIKSTTDYPKIIKELCFLPAAIYKTSTIISGVLQNAYTNIPFMFPHLAVACNIINNNGKFFLPAKDLIPKIGADRTPCEVLYLKGSDSAYKTEMVRNMFWGVGFINSVQLIKDRKLRASILNNSSNSGFFSFIFTRFRDNKRHYKGNSRNTHLVWCCLNFPQKIKFLIALLLINILYFYVPIAKMFKKDKTSCK